MTFNERNPEDDNSSVQCEEWMFCDIDVLQHISKLKSCL